MIFNYLNSNQDYEIFIEQYKLRNGLKKKLKTISPEMFNEMNNRTIGHLLKEF